MNMFARLIAAVSLASSISMVNAQSLEFDVQQALAYGTPDGTKITGDLYVPRPTGKYPAIVAVHGGGWQVGNATFYRYWGPYLARRGYVVFAIDYRLVQAGKKIYPEAVHDVRAAVQFLRHRAEEFRIDPNRIGMMGDSAGAHLSALVALAGDKPPFNEGSKGEPYAGASARVKAVVGFYGVYDMTAQWEHDLLHRPFDNITQKFLGAPLSENRRLYWEASPLSYATRDNNQTSFLLTWGTEDDIVDRATQSDKFLVALKQAGFFVRPVIVQGSPHFWAVDPIEESGSFSGFLAPRMLRFLQERL
jgi:acetyl esterase/lipase